MEDREYTITIHTSEIKEVTKQQYIAHIEQKLKFRYNEVMEAKVKSVKANAKLIEEMEKLDLIKMELKTFVGPIRVNEHIDYCKWAYEEMNPKKHQILKNNPVG